MVVFSLGFWILRLRRHFCGPDSRKYFYLFSSFGPVLSTCREGTPVTCSFRFFVPKGFLAWFPCSLGPGVPGLGPVFLACFTHPSFGPGLALLGVVLPIPFLGRFRLFWVWSLGFFGFFPPVAIVCQDFLVSFSWFPNMVFLCTNTCVVHVPAAILSDRKSTRLNSSHVRTSRMPSSA